MERWLAFSRSSAYPKPNPAQPTLLKVRDELEQYLSEPPVDNISYKADPVAWWRDVGVVHFPRLSYMAVDFLSIASSSTELGRDLTSRGSMVTTSPSRQRRHIVAIAQCLRYWIKLGIYQPSLDLNLQGGAVGGGFLDE